jgi:hypothetical protein
MRRYLRDHSITDTIQHVEHQPEDDCRNVAERIDDDGLSDIPPSGFPDRSDRLLGAAYDRVQDSRPAFLIF